MPETDEYFALAASDLSSAGARFKETEDALYALKATLDDCIKRLARLTNEECRSGSQSDEHDHQPFTGANAEEATRAAGDKLEVCFNRLARLSTDKLAGASPSDDRVEKHPLWPPASRTPGAPTTLKSH